MVLLFQATTTKGRKHSNVSKLIENLASPFRIMRQHVQKEIAKREAVKSVRTMYRSAIRNEARVRCKISIYFRIFYLRSANCLLLLVQATNDQPVTSKMADEEDDVSNNSVSVTDDFCITTAAMGSYEEDFMQMQMQNASATAQRFDLISSKSQ